METNVTRYKNEERFVQGTLFAKYIGVIYKLNCIGYITIYAIVRIANWCQHETATINYLYRVCYVSDINRLKY